MTSTTENIIFNANDLSSGNIDYASIARNTEASIPEVISRETMRGLTFHGGRNAVHFEPYINRSNWEHLTNIAASTTYAPYELVDTWHTIESQPLRCFDELLRNQVNHPRTRDDFYTEYLFDVLEDINDQGGYRFSEQTAVPIPGDKLIEVLSAE